MSNAVDLAGKLNATTAANLVKNAITHVGRYLSHTTWKGLDPVEVNAIKGAGLQIFSIYETNPTSVSYFTPDKGKSDALDGIALAQAVGQPTGTTIYFTVDYDVQPADYPAILAYFQAVKTNLSGYKLGAYGNYAILNFLHSNNAADYYFQTCAWSGGQRNNFLNIYQYQCDKQNWNNTGLNVDLDNVEKDDIGAWGQVEQVTVAEVPNSDYIGKTLTSKVDGLWYYNTPKWSTCDGTSNKGDSWIITKELTVNGGRMLLCHDGKYRTADSQYVDVTPKPLEWPYTVQVDGVTLKEAQEIVIYIGQNYKNAKAQGIAK